MKIQIEEADLRSVLRALEDLLGEKSYWWQEVDCGKVDELEKAEEICKQALADHVPDATKMIEEKNT